MALFKLLSRGALTAPCALILAIALTQSLPSLAGNFRQQNETHTDAAFKQLADILTNYGHKQHSAESPLFDEQIPHRSTPELTTLSSSMLKSYIRANNMRAYHLDLHSYRPEAKFSGDPKFVDSESYEHKLRCSRHLAHFHNLLLAFHESDPVLAKNSLDSIRLADTFGRPEAGVLRGNQFWLGDHDTCLDFATSATQKPIKGHYCLGVGQFPNWNAQDSKTSIKLGMCLPETCTSSMLNDEPELFATVQAMAKLQLSSQPRGPYAKLTLRQVYCLPHETSQIRQFSGSGLALLTVLGSFLIACLAATTIDYLDRKEQLAVKRESVSRTRTIFIESFSLSRNVEKFFHVRPDPEERQLASESQGKLPEAINFSRATLLNSMAGIKCIGLCWIIAAHTFLVAPITARNVIDADKLTQTTLADIMLAAHFMVDTFFCLSGILAAYLIFHEGVEKIRPKHWLVMTVHRYWRLAPLYLLCYWYTKSLGHLFSSGPLWDYSTSEVSPRLQCQRESWWSALLMLSDFKSPKDHCVPFAWFSANGMKFWMLTPLFLVAISRSIRRGYALAGATILANMVIVVTLSMRSTVDMKSIIEFKPESADNMLNDMSDVYTRPYSRIGAYLIGLLAGHLFYLIDTNQLKVRLSSNANAAIWTLSSLVVFILTFMLRFANSLKLDEEAIPYLFGFSSGLIRPLWSLCTCWLVFSLARGQLPGLASFLSSRFWRIMVKLSFCGYLVQGEILAPLFLATSQANSFTYVDMLTRPIASIALTILVSFVMVLTLEYPLVGIEQLILPKRPAASKELTKPEAPLAEAASSQARATLQAGPKGGCEKLKTC